MTALAASPLPADLGRFDWDVARGTTAWSDSVYRLLGYERHQVVPTTALALRHKHAADFHGCIDALHVGMHTNQLIVHEHRLVDTSGHVRPAVLVARPLTDGSGPVRGLRGFLLPTGLNAWRPHHHRGAASLIPVLMGAFAVSEATARVLLAARRPLPARRTPRDEAFARTFTSPGHSPRLVLGDGMFPLEHLTVDAVELAA